MGESGYTGRISHSRDVELSQTVDVCARITSGNNKSARGDVSVQFGLENYISILRVIRHGYKRGTSGNRSIE